MRLRTAGVGFALALTASPSVAQVPPAATLGQLRPVEDAPTTARGQFPDPRTVSAPAAPSRPLFRMQPAPTPGAAPGAAPLGPPKPIPNPMVTEYRDQNGQPIPYGQPIPIGPPVPLASTGGYLVPPPLTVNPACPTYVPGTPLAAGAPVYDSLGLDSPAFGGGYGHTLFPRRFRDAVAGEISGGRLTFGAEYLLWFVRAQKVPTLFTTSSPAFNGILGQGDTRPLFGNQAIGRSQQDGGRFTAGYQFANRNWGIDGSLFFLGTNSGNYSVNNNTDSLIARPFTSANTGQPFSQLTAYPGLSTGSAHVDFNTYIWGAEVNLKRALLCPTPCSRLDFLVGYKTFNLSESLNISESFARTPNSPTSIGVPNALAGVVTDRFRTENHFDGLNIGFQGEIQRGRFYLQGKASVALGQVYQQVQINGGQTIATTDGVIQSAGGLLALPGANIGSYSQTKFGVLPELGVTLGVNLTPRLRLGVGYSFLYLNSVVRPGAQIDTTLDVTRIPNFPLNPSPAANPLVRPSALPLRDTDFFVQGVNFQLQWTW